MDHPTHAEPSTHSEQFAFLKDRIHAGAYRVGMDRIVVMRLMHPAWGRIRKGRGAIIAGLVLLLVGAMKPAVNADTLTLERSHGYLFTSIAVNGTSVRAMIDFGDPFALQLASSFVRTHEIAVSRTGMTAGYTSGQTFNLYEGTVDEVVIGDRVITDMVFMTAFEEIDTIATHLGEPFEATIGWGFFREVSFTLDYRAETLTLGEYLCGDSAASVPIRSDAPYLILDLTIDTIPASFIVDTADPSAVLDATFAESHSPLITDMPEDRTTSNSVMGGPPRRRAELSTGTWMQRIDFELFDLNALEPLSVVGILGNSFLHSVVLCYAPDRSHVLLGEPE